MRIRVIINWAVCGLVVTVIAALAPARIYMTLGERHIAAGRYNEAENCFKKAMAYVDDSCASCGLGIAYWKSGRYAEAEKAFKRSIALNPNDSCAYDGSGRMYYDLERYPEAAEVFQQETRLSPTVNSYLFLGNADTYSGKYAEAVNAYRQAIQIQPDSVTTHTQLGVAFEYLKQYTEAIASYQRAISLIPDTLDAHCGLARTYHAIGDKRARFEQSECQRP